MALIRFMQREVDRFVGESGSETLMAVCDEKLVFALACQNAICNELFHRRWIELEYEVARGYENALAFDFWIVNRYLHFEDTYGTPILRKFASQARMLAPSARDKAMGFITKVTSEWKGHQARRLGAWWARISYLTEGVAFEEVDGALLGD